MLCYLGVSLLVWAWVLLGRAVLAGRAGGRAVLCTAAVWMAPLILAPPLFTRDVFSYLAQGTLALHGYDPYAVGPEALPGELINNVHPFWQATPAPYGPLFILLARAIAAATGDNLVAAVIVMRLVLLVGLVLLVVALPGLARHLGGRAAVALWVVVANPVLVVHLVGGPHNDLLVIGLLSTHALSELTHWIVDLVVAVPKQPFVDVTRLLGGLALVLLAGRQWWVARNGGPQAVRRAGMVLLAGALLSPVTFPWYFSWGSALLAAQRWAPHGLRNLVLASAFLVVVVYPDGEEAMYNWPLMLAAAAGAVLAALSLGRADRSDVTRTPRPGVMAQLGDLVTVMARLRPILR